MPEEAPEDHGVGDVGDGELVEAQQRRLVGELVCHRPDGIVALHLAALQRLAVGEDTLVCVARNPWKWTRRFGPGATSWNRSISMVLPRPTEPQT